MIYFANAEELTLEKVKMLALKASDAYKAFRDWLFAYEPVVKQRNRYNKLDANQKEAYSKLSDGQQLTLFGDVDDAIALVKDAKEVVFNHALNVTNAQLSEDDFGSLSERRVEYTITNLFLARNNAANAANLRQLQQLQEYLNHYYKHLDEQDPETDWTPVDLAMTMAEIDNFRAFDRNMSNVTMAEIENYGLQAFLL